MSTEDDLNKEGRRTHIERIYGKDESVDESGGPDNSDFWVDVEVLDRMVVDGSAYRGGRVEPQRSVWHFQEDQKTREKFRDYTEKQVSAPDDETMYITVKVWDQTYSARVPGAIWRNYDSSGTKGSPPEIRAVEIRKVVRREISDEYMEDVNDEGKPLPPRDPEAYLAAIEGTNETDEDTFLNVEFITEWRTKRAQGVWYQETVVHVDLYVSDLIPEEPGDPTDPNVVRLDPLQWVVNVGFGGALAVEFTGDGGVGAGSVGFGP